MGVLSVAFLSLIKWVVNRLPIDNVSYFGGYVARTIGPRTKRHKRAVLNMKHALPAYSDDVIEKTAVGMWDNFGRTIAESFVLNRITIDPDRVVLENPEVLTKLDKQNQATVFVGLHFGNWECTAIPALKLKLELLGLYKASKDVRFNNWLKAQRADIYPAGLVPGTSSSLLKILRHIKKGGAVCLLGDHTNPTGLNVNFFGNALPSTTVPATLSVRHGARIIVARVDRKKNAHFSVYLEEIPITRTGNLDEDILAATTKIQSVFEQWISADPEKWLWFYKRWPKQ